MSRPKSPATLERERDREIRRQRRAIKRREQEERLAEHRARKERRENVRNGGPILVKTDSEADPCYRALRSFHPMQFCESCREIKREDWMKTDTLCLACSYDSKGGAIRKTSSNKAEEAKSGATPTAAPPFGTKRGTRAEPEPSGDSSPQLLLPI